MHLGRNTIRTMLAFLIAAALLATATKMADAKTFVVTERGDHAPGNCDKSDCTLREAVIAATAKPSDDKVKLPDTTPYLLKREPGAGPDAERGDLDVGVAVGPGNVTKIVHPGNGRATIDPSASGDRAIELVGNLELKRIKLTGGNAEHGEQSGGAINARGALVVRDSVINGNTAPDVGGGIYIQTGVAVVERTRFHNNTGGNGGAFFIGEGAHIELTESTVDGNHGGGSGGATYIETDLFSGGNRIVRSTFSGNESGNDGGAIYADSQNISLENSTFAANRADGRGGALYSAPDSLSRFYNVTLARNRSDADNTGAGDSGGGIYADGGSDVVEIRNSLVARNLTTGGAVNECDAPAPVGIESLGGNLITSTAGGCTFFSDPEDHGVGNAGIKDLADNGGPTKTIALEAGSPAIDEADGPNPLAVDQRGVARDNPDIGAYER